jgi:hypothetical protein
MRILRTTAAACAAVAFVLLLGACASTQRSIPLSYDALTAKPTRVGVALANVPPPDTTFPGANCLLCYGAASIANQSLTAFAKTLPSDDLMSLPDDIAQRLRAKGVAATAITERIDLAKLSGIRGAGTNVAKYDFAALGAKYGVEKLIVLEVTTLGFTRSYSMYTPISDPVGAVYGTGYMVDVRSNTYEWYQPIRGTKSADGPWDEPPKYPGLANAYFQAIESSKDQVMQSFAEK